MGAQTFTRRSEVDDAQDAFKKLADRDRFMNGHGPYTGNIGQKSSFTMIDVPDSITGEEALEIWQACRIDADDELVVSDWYKDKLDWLEETVEQHEDFARELVNRESPWNQKWSDTCGCIPLDDEWAFIGNTSC